jgi:hypothetical protein
MIKYLIKKPLPQELYPVHELLNTHRFFTGVQDQPKKKKDQPYNPMTDQNYA